KERRIEWQQRKPKRRRGKASSRTFGTVGDAAMHPRSFLGEPHANSFVAKVAFVGRKGGGPRPSPRDQGSDSQASKDRGLSSTGCISIRSSPVAAPSSLNLRAATKTRFSRDPVASL